MRIAHRTTTRTLGGVLVLLAIGSAAAHAQTVSADDRDALIRQHAARGGEPRALEPVLARIDQAASAGLPTAPLVNKLREGLAKRAALSRIEQVVDDMAADLASADGLLRGLAAPSPGDRAAATVLLADALANGLAADAVREIARQAVSAGAAASSATLASAARGLSYIASASLPVGEGTAVVVEAVRRGYRPPDVIEIGREIKRREGDYRSGRLTLTSLRQAIARGDRPDQLFSAERPAARRPDAPTAPERPTRPTPVERPVRPERPVPPERPATR